MCALFPSREDKKAVSSPTDASQNLETYGHFVYSNTKTEIASMIDPRVRLIFHKDLVIKYFYVILPLPMIQGKQLSVDG